MSRIVAYYGGNIFNQQDRVIVGNGINQRVKSSVFTNQIITASTFWISFSFKADSFTGNKSVWAGSTIDYFVINSGGGSFVVAFGNGNITYTYALQTGSWYDVYIHKTPTGGSVYINGVLVTGSGSWNAPNFQNFTSILSYTTGSGGGQIWLEGAANNFVIVNNLSPTAPQIAAYYASGGNNPSLLGQDPDVWLAFEDNVDNSGTDGSVWIAENNPTYEDR